MRLRPWHWCLGGLVLVLALYLRWPWPEPTWTHIDERALVEYPLGFWSGDLNPHFFNYPTLQLYLVSALYYVYYLLGGDQPLQSFLAYHYLVDARPLLGLARGLNSLMATATVAAAMGLGGYLYGPVGGLLAGLFLALMPLHVRFAHLAITDVPMVLWTTLAVLCAVRIAGQGRRIDYLLAGLCAGLAGATKYPGAASALAMLAGALAHRPTLRNAHLCLSGLVALLAFALTSPYVWLDLPHFWTHFSIMAQVHLGGQVRHAEDPSWLYMVRHGLRYGLGLAGLAATLMALLCYPRRWRREEGVLLATLAGHGVLLLYGSPYMRYALPLAPLLAVLWVRPLMVRPRRSWVVALCAALVLAEPAHASLKTRALLSGPDTRAQVLSLLHRDYPGGTRLLHVPGGWAGRVEVLDQLSVFNRFASFVQSFGLKRLIAGCALLGQREDLPPLYPSWELKNIRALLAGPDSQRARTIPVLEYRHPILKEALPPLDLPGLTWQSQSTPGALDEAVFDGLDWYFLPISGWHQAQGTGPVIRLGLLPVSLEAALPTAQEFFALAATLLACKQASQEHDWPAARRWGERLLATPFFLPELIPTSYLHEFYLELGMARYYLEQPEGAIACWQEAALLRPHLPGAFLNLGIAYADLGQHQRAVSAYLKALQNAPHDPAIAYHLGLSYIRLGEYAQSIEALARAVAVHPRADAYINMGLAYGHLGRAEEQRACFAKALELAPDHPQAPALRQWLEAGTD